MSAVLEMTKEFTEPLVLCVSTGGTSARRTFLLQDVAALIEPLAAAFAFVDLDESSLELLIHRPDRVELAAWLAAALRYGRIQRVSVAVEAAVLSDTLFSSPTERTVCSAELCVLSAQALEILRAHAGASVPVGVAATEIVELHRRRGEPERSIAWQAAWLRSRERALSTPEPPTAEIMLTARLAHGHWLRLQDAKPDLAVEIAMLDTLRDRRGR